MKKKSIIIIAIALCLSLLALLALSVYQIDKTALGLRMAWNSDTDKLDELKKSRFRIILFPCITLTDENAKNPLSVERGFLVSLEESERQEIEVWLDGKSELYERKLFTSYPPSDKYQNYIHQLNQQIKAWKDDTDWAHVNYSFSSNSDTPLVILKIKCKRNYDYEYAYECDKSGAVKPKWIKFNR
ncbi:MAG: hypothetical protein JXD22_10645 [Sedimentisphaerales bacterium]|nr:hypothetical protein [Sedimentisphaerales bacterium]